MQNNEFTVAEITETLKLLEHLCPSQDDYKNLCLLLTLPKLSDHIQFKQWNPSAQRVECFTAVYPLVQPFLNSTEKKEPNSGFSANDRLLQLIVKGIFYESCVDYCQNKAIRKAEQPQQVMFTHLLNGHKLVDADLSLVSWLENLPNDVFSMPFEQRALQLKLDELRKPALDAVWTEQIILATPIRPKIFPHAAVNFFFLFFHRKIFLLKFFVYFY